MPLLRRRHHRRPTWARCGGREVGHRSLRWRRDPGSGSPLPPLSSVRSGRGRRRGGRHSHSQKSRLL